MNINIASIAWLMLIALPLQSATLHTAQLFAADPQIAEISTDEVRTLLDNQQAVEAEAKESGRPALQPEIVLVDVRSEAEIAISVIPGAITKQAFEENRQKYAGRTVVPYCAVGGRSARYAEKLAEQGLQVKNYKGSILAWVTAELPLVTLDGKPTNRLFAFSENHNIPAKYEQTRK